MTSIVGKPSIISFRDSANKILRDKWIADKVIDVDNQSEHIIEMAASIILNDIRMAVYDMYECATLEAMENVDTLIPNSLKNFWNKLVKCKSKTFTVSDRKCRTIAHAITSAGRPRSFISPLLLEISVYIHRKYASHELIDILSSLSFADDYTEVQ